MGVTWIFFSHSPFNFLWGYLKENVYFQKPFEDVLQRFIEGTRESVASDVIKNVIKSQFIFCVYSSQCPKKLLLEYAEVFLKIF